MTYFKSEKNNIDINIYVELENDTDEPTWVAEIDADIEIKRMTPVKQ